MDGFGNQRVHCNLMSGIGLFHLDALDAFFSLLAHASRIPLAPPLFLLFYLR